MFKMNLRIALRNLKKNKSTAAINILGLAVGISASLVIFLIVRYDFSFDKWEPQNSQIYRVYTKIGEQGTNQGINQFVPTEIQRKIAGVNCVSHVYVANKLKYGQVSGLPEKRVVTKWGSTVFASPDYFELFPRVWLAGTPNVLSDLNTIVLAESEAGKFFPGVPYKSVVGRIITFNDSVQLTVRGITADLKEHSDFDYKNFVSYKTISEGQLKNRYGSASWSSVNSASVCFVRLAKNVSPAVVNRQIANLYLTHMIDVKPKYRHTGILQPLSDIHFNTEIDGKVSKSSLFNLGVLALLLLLLASINFINLATAQSTLRAKEIGVRKVVGSDNRHIIYQFLTETFLLTIFATILAIIMTPFLLRIFNGFVPEGMSIREVFTPDVLLFLSTIIVLVTFLAGLYPAFVLTRFKPVSVMKNQTIKEGKSGSARLRQILTVSQFVIAQVFLIVVVVIGKQVRYVMDKDLGFRKDAIVSIDIPFLAGTKSDKATLFNKLKRMSGVQEVTLSTGTPTLDGYNFNSITLLKDGKKTSFEDINSRGVDNYYLSLFDIKLLAGRNIQLDSLSRLREVLINETLMHEMGVNNPDKILGQYLVDGGENDSSVIVGVLHDFTTQSLHNPISPTILYADGRYNGYVFSMLLNAGDVGNWQRTITSIGKRFNEIYPNFDFDYRFYDQTLKDLYDADRRLSVLLKWATSIAIFISCLGLLGLVSFMANQRTKEIGIRKILGASVSSIISLLSRSLIKLVLLASVIAFPFAWYFSHKWLQGFAFRTSIGWGVFALCALGMLLIALAVLWMRTIKAAKANPVFSLRDE